ncbi:MAG: hypothetical protein QOH23_2222, partial [Gaiellaceae bacterium]|nr:hypothetical protein [Gaiellaceae bacterium]
MRPATRIRNPVMTGYLPSGGTDDAAIVYPFWVSINWRERVRLIGEAMRYFARKERPTLLWIGFLVSACLAAATLLVANGYGLPLWWQLFPLAVVTAATERQSVRVARNVETSVAFLPFVFTAVAFGPLTALVV